MVRVSLPFRGVAVVLVFASAAAGQTPLPTADFSDTFFRPTQPTIFWQFPSEMSSFFDDDEASPLLETEMPPLAETLGETSLISFEAPATKDSPRLKPTPDAKAAAKPNAAPAATTEECPEVVEEEAFPCVPTMLPFACPPPQQAHCRKCARRQRRHHRGHQGGCGQGYGNAYGAWSCGFEGCSNFCAPPPPAPTCRRCQRKHGHRNNAGYAGCAGWGAFGGMGCEGFMGQACPSFYCNPYPQQSCRRCQRKHARHNRGGSGCGYDGCGYGAGAYDCFSPYMAPNGYGGGCGHHRRGLFHRHSCRQQQAPYSYQAPCYGYPTMMDAGFCSDCIE